MKIQTNYMTMYHLLLKTTALLILNCTAIDSFAQKNRVWGSSLSFQGNGTFYDRTRTNNISGVGFGFQGYIGRDARFKGIIEVNADLFAGTKELYLTADERPINAKSGVLGIYAGGMYQPHPAIFFTTTIGTSIFNNQVHPGIRPSVGFYPSKKRTWMIRPSLTHIFQRDDISNQSFIYMSVAVGLKIR